jgi:hypothetical protein
MVADAPPYLDNDGDSPAWVREDLAANVAEVLAYIQGEFGWGLEEEPDVEPPMPMAPMYGPHRDSEEHWHVCEPEDAKARYWRITW